MIKKQTPISMIEVTEILKETKTDNPELKAFIEKFVRLKIKDSQKLNEEIRTIGIILKEEEIIKLIDFMPEDSQDINKILAENNLNQDEQNKILEIFKNYY